MEYYVVIDLEMCMVDKVMKRYMRGMRNEIIQIGAVMLDMSHNIVDEFSTYVRPLYGELDEFIIELTGITDNDLTDAPILRTAIDRFVSWIGDRQVTVMSWSASDYYQLQNEMRAKEIKNNTVDRLFETWLDFQRTFDKMIGSSKQCALEDAMRIGHIEPLGRIHNGLCDAYNTARLFRKIHRQIAVIPDFKPIEQYIKEQPVEQLSYSLGNFFTPAMMAMLRKNEAEQLSESDKDAENTDEYEDMISDVQWCFKRRVHEMLNEDEDDESNGLVETGNIDDKTCCKDNWYGENVRILEREMRRIDITQQLTNMLIKNRVDIAC